MSGREILIFIEKKWAGEEEGRDDNGKMTRRRRERDNNAKKWENEDG